MSTAFTLLSLLAFVVLTAGTAVFVAAEFSLTALERSTVDANARTGGRRDQLVQRAHRTLSFQLSGAQVGISVTTLITGYLAEPLIARLLEPLFAGLALSAGVAGGLALGLSLLIATSVSMVFGELVAQYLAVAKPLETARVVAGPQVLFSMFFTPVIKLTNGTANWILRQFGSRTAEELMTPRSKIEVLQADQNVADLVVMAMETGYSRFPIVEGDLDETIGLVHVKQVFEVAPDNRPRTGLAGLARAVPVVPSTLDGDDVMAQVRASGLQTVLVVDEYGGTAGMVTMEDLIEEIVGDVRDEHDDVTPDVLRMSRDSWRVSGLLRIDEVAENAGFRAPEGEYETIGGLVMQELGHIPNPGEAVELTAFDTDGPMDDPVRWLATVVRMDGRRIDLLELTRQGRRGDSDDEDGAR